MEEGVARHQAINLTESELTNLSIEQLNDRFNHAYYQGYNSNNNKITKEIWVDILNETQKEISKRKLN